MPRVVTGHKIENIADNYLERKMEEYRSGRSASPSFRRKGILNVAFPSRRVLVTGGASGIGREIVTRFSNAGSRVAFFDKDAVKGRETMEKTGARFSCVDVSDVEQLEKALAGLLAHWGDIDIVINNAGIFSHTALDETTTGSFDHILDTNLRPAFVIARTLSRHRKTLPLANSFGGRIINISSTRHLMSEADTVAYSVSKGGIASMTHSLMMSLSPLGITVNTISPGWIETGDYDALTEDDHLQHPSRRVGRPADIARVCMFLSLPDNDFINGADIVVDGGMTRKMIYL